MPRTHSPPVDPGLAQARRRGLGVFTLAILPALMAIWCVPWFVTQDGPAHVYNAHILLESLKPDSPFRDDYAVRWEPLPNWTGHLALMGLLAVLPPRAADRVMMTVTLVGLAASVVWLRWRVAGWRGMPLVALLAVLLALNLTWLLGFYSFLLGACLYPITLGLWWAGRERPGPRSALAVAGSLILGYFCHLVSLGLTALSLMVLAALLPGPRRSGRVAWTLVGLTPLIPLALVYRHVMRTGGGLHPSWRCLSEPWSLGSWVTQMIWINPLWPGPSRFDLLSQFSLVVALLVVPLCPLIFRPEGRGGESAPLRERRGWRLLALLFLLGSLLVPDGFAHHGHMLPQRVFLFGLVASIPGLGLEETRRRYRLGLLILTVAVMAQSALVWNYALDSQRRAGAFMRAKSHVGTKQRVAVLWIGIFDPFRANPLLNLYGMLGIGTGNVVWNNYESNHYYFPVQLRARFAGPPAAEFESIAMMTSSGRTAESADRWRRLLGRYHGAIDALVVYGEDATLDAINARWFRPVFQGGGVKVLRARRAR